ncbi:MAG TPA: NAD(P)H-hydrate dehydratase [Flavobacteriales bacterium]|nr:NAD(P)H-hydrate dehydratase [Flavobacteriales bacterium]
MARLLKQQGIGVRVARVRHRAEPSAENVHNQLRAVEVGVHIDEIDARCDNVQVLENEIIIDSIVGTGLNSPLIGPMADVVRWINGSGRPVVALDVPSGLFTEDNRANDPKHIVKATLTITFEEPKLAFFLAENADHVGDWEVVPIGLDRPFLEDQRTIHRLIERSDVIGFLRPRARFAHKGTFGHALVVAGGSGHAGAAVLATRAALRSGAGLVTTHVPGTCEPIVQVLAPEAMCSADPSDEAVTTLPKVGNFSAIGIGPGLGMAPDTALVIKRLLQDRPAPLVIDADALNILAQEPTWLAFLPPGTILTPHPKEFDRLAGRSLGSGYERLELAREMALKNRCVVVLKGAWTAICDPLGQVFFNPTGDPGMAKGGSGDALTGLLTGLLAQGYPPLPAALLGVYLHGLAGDIAAHGLGMDGMTVGDLIEALPRAWQALRDPSEQAFQ